MCYPSQDWGWAVQWIDKQKCDISLSIDPDVAKKPVFEQMPSMSDKKMSVRRKEQREKSKAKGKRGQEEEERI